MEVHQLELSWLMQLLKLIIGEECLPIPNHLNEMRNIIKYLKFLDNKFYEIGIYILQLTIYSNLEKPFGI